MKLQCVVTKESIAPVRAHEHECTLPSCNIVKMCRFSPEGQKLASLLTKHDYNVYVESLKEEKK